MISASRSRFLALIFSLHAALIVSGAAAEGVELPKELEQAARLLQSRELEKAEMELQAILQANPEDPHALNMLGLIRGEQKRFEEAEQLFKRAVELNPKLYAAYVNVGYLYRKQDQPARSWWAFHQAFAIAPDDPEVRFNLGRLCAERGEFAKALEYLESIPAEFRHSIETLRYLAGASLKLGKTTQAWNYAADMRRLAPNVPEILHLFAQVSLENNLVQEAILATRKATALEPDNPEYVFFLGKVLLESPDFREARPQFERYLKMKPNQAEGHLALGYTLYLEQNYSEARKHLYESLRLNPNQIQPYYHLGMIAHELGEDGESLELLDRVIQQQPHHAMARLVLGKVYARKTDYQKARAEFEYALKLQPGEPKLHYNLSQLYLRLGERELARQQQELYQHHQKLREQKIKESGQLPFTSPASDTKGP